jgi:hypothetical protein
MSQQKRYIIGLIIIVSILTVVLITDQIQRKNRAEAVPGLEPGAIPIYLQGELHTGFVPDDLDQLENVRFVDDEEGKTQEGWLLKDVLQLYLEDAKIRPNSIVIVTSSSREKSIKMTWEDIADPANMVMFDLSGRGTMKLVSKGLENLDIRDEWIQDVDKIEVTP